MKKYLTIFIFAFLQFYGFGQQWHKLPDPVNPGTGSSFSTQWQNFPSAIVPLANGKIMYTNFYHIGGGQGSETFELYISTNDLSSGSCKLCPAVYKAPGLGSIGLGYIVPYDDSTVSWVQSYQGFEFHRANWSTFSNAKTLQYPNNSAKIGAQLATHNYLYAFVKNVASVPPYGDTTTFVRTARNSTVTTYIKLSKYVFNDWALDQGIQFLNDSAGYAFIKYTNNTSKTVLMKTVDFGNTWTELYVDSINQIVEMDFPSLSVGYLKKSNNDLFKTTNGGSSWTQITNPMSGSITCLKFGNDTIGYLAGNSGELWKTTNGGINWTSEVSTTTANISAVYAFGDVAYFVTNGWKVYKNAPDVVSVKENSSQISQLNIFPNPVDDLLMIDFPKTSETIGVEIYDPCGKILVEEKENLDGATRIKLDVSTLNSGIYLVRIKQGGEVITKKINVIH